MKTSKEKKQSKKSRSSGEKYRSITTDLGIMIITLSTIAVLVLGGVFAYLFNANIKANLETQLKAGAGENALVLEKYITGMQIYSESMAESFRNFKIMGEAQGGSMIRGTLKSAVESGRVFSAYAAFEPNLFFTSTPRGLSYYAYDLGAGVQVDTANNYEVYAAEDYYAKAKESLAVHVTAPYAHTMPDGTQIFLISLSTPIIVNGRFVGVANCDIRADDLLSLGYSAEGFDAHYQMFVDSEDKVLMHSLKPELAGQPANSRERIDALKSSGESRMSHWQDAALGEKVMGVYVPLHLNGTDVEWYSAFVVSYREARAALFRTIGIVAILGILGIIIMAALCMRVIHRTMAPIKPLTSMAESMGRFDIDHIDTAYRFPKNEIGRLADSFLGMSEGLRNIVKDIDGLLGAMAEGDFASGSENPEKYVGAMENVLHSLQQIQTRLGSSLSAISYSADQVAGSSHQIASGAQSLAQGASEQASSLEELTSMVNVVNDDVRSNAKNAELASEIAVSTQHAITEGNAEMKELKESMDNIAEASMQIQAVIGLIDSIAFQTNILALNAAIEAARAGEAGKGFAVVADEVRNLAQKSAEAAQSTGELINTSVAAVEKGKGIAEETARAMQSVAEYAEKSKDMISMISEASRKQAEAITQIHTGLNQIASVVQTTSSTSEESAAASQELSHEAERLKELVSPYRFS